MQLKAKKARNVKAAAPVAENLLPAIVPGAPVASLLPAPPAEIILPESAPVAESKPTAADKRAAYIADYAQAKAIFAALSGAVSIPVKPGAFKAKPLNPKAYSLTERGAAAIYVAVAASGKAFADRETYARAFTIGGTSYTIDRGKRTGRKPSPSCRVPLPPSARNSGAKFLPSPSNRIGEASASPPYPHGVKQKLSQNKFFYPHPTREVPEIPADFLKRL